MLQGTLSKWDGARKMKCKVYRTLEDAVTDINHVKF